MTLLCAFLSHTGYLNLGEQTTLGAESWDLLEETMRCAACVLRLRTITGET